MLVTKLFRNTIYSLFGSTTNIGVSNVGAVKGRILVTNVGVFILLVKQDFCYIIKITNTPTFYSRNVNSDV